MQDGLMFPRVFNIDSMRFSSYFQEIAECQGHVFGWGRVSTNNIRKTGNISDYFSKIKNYFRTILVHRNAYLVHRNAYLVHRNAYLVHRNAYFALFSAKLSSFWKVFPKLSSSENAYKPHQLPLPNSPLPLLAPKNSGPAFGGC